VLRVPEPQTHSPEIEARFLLLKNQALEAVQLLPQAAPELLAAFQSITAPGALADLAVTYMDVTPPEKQEVLETIDIVARMDKISRLLAHRIEVLRLSREISEQTRSALDQRQREVLLREQMAAIQRQLGEGDDGKAAEMKELNEAITKAKMPPEVEQQARKELRRLERMPDSSAEYGMVRTYLDWLIELPWAAPDPVAIDIARCCANTVPAATVVANAKTASPSLCCLLISRFDIPFLPWLFCSLSTLCGKSRWNEFLFQ